MPFNMCISFEVKNKMIATRLYIVQHLVTVHESSDVTNISEASWKKGLVIRYPVPILNNKSAQVSVSFH